MLSDLKFAFRQLLKSPAFTLVAVLSLALGIGANTAIFSLVNEVALKTLPVKNPQELVLFNWLSDSPGMMHSTWGWGSIDPVTKLQTSSSFSKLTYERFRDHSQTLAGAMAFAPLDSSTVVADGRAEVVSQSQVVSGNFFSGLGVSAQLGRILGPEDDRPGAPPAAVISDQYWQRRFGGDPAVLGKTLTLNSQPFTVVGVTPANFTGTQQVGENPDISIPLAFIEQVITDKEITQPWSWWLRIMGRRQPGVTMEQVAAELETVFQQSAREGDEAMPKGREPARTKPVAVPLLRVGPGAQGLTEQRARMAGTLKILAGLVGLVLAIACINVANLLLARGTARRKEIAVRLALGASRWRVIRQLLIESLVLAALGAGLGLVFAHWGADVLLALNPFGRGLQLDLKLDRTVLGFTAGTAVLTGVIFGLAPALGATRLDVGAGLQGSGKQGGSSARAVLPKILMVVQVGLSLVLLVGAGLFLRTLQSLREVDVGFNRTHLLMFRLDASTAGYEKNKYAGVYERVTGLIRNLPGVRAATFSHIALLGNGMASSSVYIDGRPTPTGRGTSPSFNRVESTFFETYQMPLVTGRLFTARDDEGAPKVAVINQTMARTYFGTENPVGQFFHQGRNPENNPPIEVVGVVRDAHYSDLRSAVPPTVFISYRQDPTNVGNFAVRTDGDPAALTTAVRKIVQDVDPNLPVANVRTLDEQVTRLMAQEILFGRLSTFFGVVALALACIGLYGLMSYAVLRRTTEIGIRMALGALPANVRWMILRESLVLVCLGVALGLGGAWAATQAVTAMLYGLSPHDPLVYGGMALLLIAVAVLACWLPARAATRVDPMIALRAE